jgi:hypothetical protein
MATYQARTRAPRVAPPAAAAAERAPAESAPGARAPAENAVDDLLDCAGPIAGAHALVLGRGALDVLCRLIRQGAAAAASLRRDDRSSATAPADLVILPRCGELPETEAALTLARRLLMPGGRVVLRDAGPGRGPALAALLGAQGFSHIRCRARPSGAVLTADLPFFWPAGGR